MQDEDKKNKMAAKFAKIFFTFLLIFSTVIFIIGMASLIANIQKTQKCTEEVVATCTQVKKIKHNNKYGTRPATYTPVFTYEYNNKKYEKKYGKSYSELKKDTFEEKEKYTIFVNPDKPEQFIIEGHESDIDTFAIVTPFGTGIIIIFSLIGMVVLRKSGAKKELSN